jgi:hypothetical protein
MHRDGMVIDFVDWQILENHRFHPNPRYLPYPSLHIAIRGIQEEHYTVLEVPPPVNGASNSGFGGRILEEIEFSRALFEVGTLSNLGQMF